MAEVFSATVRKVFTPVLTGRGLWDKLVRIASFCRQNYSEMLMSSPA